MKLHPAILVLGLAAVASALPLLPLLDLSALALAMLVVHMALGRAALLRVGRSLLRLRWLLLAIAVLYLGFTPGQPIVDFAPGLSREGLAEGSRRALVLMVLVSAVQAVLIVTTPSQIAAALHSFTAPLALLGFDRERFALRFALALNGVAAAQQLLPPVRRGSVEGFVEASAQAVLNVERGVASDDADVVLVPQPTVPWWQWLLPLLVGIALHWLGRQ